MNVFIRQSAQPGDSDNGMFFTFFSVMVLSLAAAILVIAGNTPSWNTACVLWFVVAGILTSLVGAARASTTGTLGAPISPPEASHATFSRAPRIVRLEPGARRAR